MKVSNYMIVQSRPKKFNYQAWASWPKPEQLPLIEVISCVSDGLPRERWVQLFVQPDIDWSFLHSLFELPLWCFSDHFNTSYCCRNTKVLCEAARSETETRKAYSVSCLWILYYCSPLVLTMDLLLCCSFQYSWACVLCSRVYMADGYHISCFLFVLEFISLFKS